MANAKTDCNMQEVQSHTVYCFVWKRGYIVSLCSDKQILLGVLTIDNSLYSVVSGLPLTLCGSGFAYQILLGKFDKLC